MPNYTYNINNGNVHYGLAVRYNAARYLEDKSVYCISGKVGVKADDDTETDEKQSAILNKNFPIIPYGESRINYKNAIILLNLIKYDKNISDDYVHTYNFLTELTIQLVNYKLDPNKDSNEQCKEFIEGFINESVDYYENTVLDRDDKKSNVTIYIFDEWWETLSKKEPRSINTVHLDGKELEMLKHIKKFQKKSTKERYKKLGIPYKQNIMFEGFPGTGKTSLIFALASELKQNLAILNFNKDVDDNVFMRAIRKIPKDCILILEDIDVLFKERKENDGYKSSITFSALLNTLDGLAFRQNMITIMTTNFECNLDIALKRPGRIDKSLNFGFAKESQIKNMFDKFFEDHKDEFKKFYKIIKSSRFTTATLQQYFIWNMDNYEGLYNEKNLSEFREICSKNNYDKKLDLYA